MGRRATTRFGPWLLAATIALAVPAAAAAEEPDPYRPEIHFSPRQNWVNDPNGPVWYEGEYHLFFQYNPEGDQWGNMSWGHAVSTDLVSWEERPVALRFTDDEHVFSGSVVVDHGNTSGLGSADRPAMVAVYTSADPRTGRQAQSLAWSADAGETWTRYEGNPVLDIGSTEFRDPKVFWYADGGYWVMAVAMSVDRRIRFYRSPDLREWSYLSDFGPAHATGGVWEMPDLFELPVDGDPSRTRWVLVVNLNPGGVAGGSGAQYFVGDFDGTTFRPDRLVSEAEPPPGTVLAGFEDGAYPAGWTATGTAFGAGPVDGTLPGQHPVRGFRGERLVNSFHGGDAAVGSLTSPQFTLSGDYVNLLVGGGRHPRVPGTGDGSAPPGRVIADFEGPDFGGWAVSGTAFGSAPQAGNAPCQTGVTGYVGAGLANSYRHGGADPCSPPPDTGTGALLSPPFVVDDDHLSFLVGGGPHADTAVRLLVDGTVVRTASGAESGVLDWASWDVSDLRGRTARIEILDARSTGWGHVMADHVVLGPEPALPRSRETTVNLVVDGVTVRSATGDDSETLDWVAWDVRDLRGRTATIEVVDTHDGGWGHVLLDHVVLGDEPARSLLEHYSWVDHGADYYAALTFENVPDGRRIAVAWMNNWLYAAATPTDGWRGAMSLPRELALRTVDGEVRLVQRPVRSVSALGRESYRVRGRMVPDGVTTLPTAAHGEVLAITADIEVRGATEVGLHVRAGAGGRTVVGYDPRAQRLLVDRRASGDAGFHPRFAGVHGAPLASRGGRVQITVYVDRSSVEVFGGGGEVAITDLVFPAAEQREVAVYAKGGAARIHSLVVRALDRGR